jgi:spore coat protein U-like protein
MRTGPGSRTTGRGIAAAALCAVLALAPAAGRAATPITTTFQVQITLVASCAISANNLNFGSGVGLLTTAVNGTSSLSVTCSNSTPYTLGLDGGNVSGSTVTARLMAGTSTGNTGTTMDFQLYTDTGHTTVWGNSSGSWVSGTGNGSAQSFTVYGQVPTQTTPKPDTYQTTITATVTY